MTWNHGAVCISQQKRVEKRQRFTQILVIQLEIVRTKKIFHHKQNHSGARKSAPAQQYSLLKRCYQNKPEKLCHGPTQAHWRLLRPSTAAWFFLLLSSSIYYRRRRDHVTSRASLINDLRLTWTRKHNYIRKTQSPINQCAKSCRLAITHLKSGPCGI